MKLAGLALLLVFCSSAKAAEAGSLTAPDQIVFVHLKKVGALVSLDSIKVVPGKLKLPKHPTLRPGDLRVLVHDGALGLLSEITLPDPGIVRFEYVDAEGRLQTSTSVRDSVHFTVRVPYHPDIYSLDFLRLSPADSSGAKQLREVPLGSIVVRAEERDDN